MHEIRLFMHKIRNITGCSPFWCAISKQRSLPYIRLMILQISTRIWLETKKLFDILDNSKKNNFTEDKPKEDKDEALEFAINGGKCRKSIKNKSTSRISASKSLRL